MHNRQLAALFQATEVVRKGAPMGNDNDTSPKSKKKSEGGFSTLLKGAPKGNHNARGPHKMKNKKPAETTAKPTESDDMDTIDGHAKALKPRI